MLFLINNIIPLFQHNKIVQISVLCVTLLSLALSLFSSIIVGCIVLGHYFLGLIACSLLLQYQSVVFPLIWDLSKQWKTSNKAHKDQTCNVCSGSKCRRYLMQDKTPWKSIRLKKKLNDAVERLFNTILSEFIESWYREFTSDVTFVANLRNSIRYSVCSAVNKLMHLDVGYIITDKLIPCTIRHIDDYLCMERIAKLKNIGIEQVAITYLGDRLHIAATNRKREVEYLRQLSSLLLPTVMPKEYMTCANFTIFMRELLSMWTLLPLMDVLADPNIINQLVILTVNAMQNRKSSHGDFKHFAKESTNHQDIMVEMLCNFGEKHVTLSPFALELKCILKDTELLYAFMQYLKREDMVHLLQFYLNLEEFNSALLRPDLSSQQLAELHQSATEIYNTYIDPITASSAHIGYDRQHSLALKQLLAGGPDRIVRLRTSEPLLFAAADFVYGILERKWLSHFYHSVHFYKYICKGKNKANGATTGIASKNNSRAGLDQCSNLVGGSQGQLQSDRSAVARISSGIGKIKGVLAVRAPIVGAPFCNAQPIHIVESQQVNDSTNCNMSLWRVSIPSVTMREHHEHKARQNTTGKWLFDVEVEANNPQHDVDDLNVSVPTDSRIGKRDIEEKRIIVHWSIIRTEQDFDTLNEKVCALLIGASIERLCPIGSSKSQTSVDERRARYERWLRQLLAQHTFLQSIAHVQYCNLLYTFLTQSESPFVPTVEKRTRSHHHQQNSPVTTGADRSAAVATATAAAAATVDLETIYQSVALRLRKEKGQHLDTSFMGTFLNSTGHHCHSTTHTHPIQTGDWADLSDAMDVVAIGTTTTIQVATTTRPQHTPTFAVTHSIFHTPKTLHSHVFNDNFGLHTELATSANSTLSDSTNSVHPRGLMESLFYLLKHILKVRVFCLRVLAALCSVVPDALQFVTQRYIDYKIRAALNQDNLTYLITQLQDVIFNKHNTSATSEQLEERKRDAYKHLTSIIPDRLANLLSSEGTEIKRCLTKLLDILHNQHLNKHLVYNLFDLILIQLHPELDEPVDNQ